MRLNDFRLICFLSESFSCGRALGLCLHFPIKLLNCYQGTGKEFVDFMYTFDFVCILLMGTIH